MSGVGPVADSVDIVVDSDHAGARLDAALGNRPEVGSRSAAQRLIEAGHVTVDGERRPKRHRLAAGERVHALLEPTQVETALDAGAEAAPFAVAYEDEHLMVVDKPAGVVVHPARGHATGTLVQALAGRAAGGGDPARAGIVHRLDRDTSGLLVVARSDTVHRALADLIRSRGIEREYLALAMGVPSAATATIDAAIGRDRRRRTIVSTDSDRPREARTHFRVLEALGPVTLLELGLETGRTHQIRAHLAAIGHPVCGDRAYGGERCGAELGLTRQFLHSSRLAFAHPVGGARVEARSPLPADLAAALGSARARSRAPTQ